MPGRVYRSLEERLLHNSIQDENGCWVWLGAVCNKGYPQIAIRVPGRKYPVCFRAHRVSYELFKGEKIPYGMQLDHTCEIQRCINPGHLAIVTPELNRYMQWSRKNE